MKYAVVETYGQSWDIAPNVKIFDSKQDALHFAYGYLGRSVLDAKIEYESDGCLHDWEGELHSPEDWFKRIQVEDHIFDGEEKGEDAILSIVNPIFDTGIYVIPMREED